MSELACPKCRLPVPDAALDAGSCPGCGYDGPMVSVTSGKWGWLVATAAVVGTGVALGGYLLYPRHEPRKPAPPPQFAAVPVVAPRVPPHVGPPVAPPPRPVETVPPRKAHSPPKPADPPPAVVPPPKPVGPTRPGRTIVLDPREEPGRKLERKLDNPAGTAAIPDLSGNDRVTLTGRVRALRIGSVNGKATIDASGLEADEVFITGDLDGDAVVKVNAPGGTVTVGGFVAGRARLTGAAPGGTVLVSEGADRLNGEAAVTVTARRVEVKSGMTGTARLLVTLTAGGSLKLATLDRNATVVYKKAAAADPDPRVEHGEIRGGAKVTAEAF